VNELSCNAEQASRQPTNNQPIRENAYVEADRHIGLAMERIEEARHDSATGAMKTCSLLLDLLAGIRTPLHRLGSVVHPRHRQHQDAADSHPMPPEFAIESSEVEQ
jgi:hypothetical protein